MKNPGPGVRVISHQYISGKIFSTSEVRYATYGNKSHMFKRVTYWARDGFPTKIHVFAVDISSHLGINEVHRFSNI